MKAEKDIEIFCEDAGDIKEKEFQKANQLKELEDLNTGWMLIKYQSIIWKQKKNKNFCNFFFNLKHFRDALLKGELPMEQFTQIQEMYLKKRLHH